MQIGAQIGILPRLIRGGLYLLGKLLPLFGRHFVDLIGQIFERLGECFGIAI